jgi:hypothetical protein
MSREKLGMMLAVAFISSVTTLAIDHVLLHAPRVAAQESGPALQEFIFFAQHRKDTEKDESFFFYNPESGDIYVYQEGEAKEHYRVRVVGEDLEKLK